MQPPGKHLIAIAVAAFCALPATGLAQTAPDTERRDPRAKLHDLCQEGVTSACIRLRMLERMRSNQEESLTPPEPATPAPLTPAPETSDDPAAGDRGDIPAAPSALPTERHGWSLGKKFGWLLTANIAVFGFISFMRRPTRAQRIRARWTAPALPLPEVLPGARVEQGQLEDYSGRGRQLFPWDRTEIDRWLDQQIKKVRGEVSEKRILAFAADIETDPSRIPASLQVVRDWMIGHWEDDAPLAAGWDNPDIRFYNLLRAKYNLCGGAFNLALATQGNDRTNLLPSDVLALWRMDADHDLNPSAVNMWHHVASNKLCDKGYLDPAAMEGYLRYFFRLGAPDGHYHIAAQLLSFYLESPICRPDEGYVAAALERVSHYDTQDHAYWLQCIKDRNLSVDLKDQRIPRGGIMFEMSRDRALH